MQSTYAVLRLIRTYLLAPRNPWLLQATHAGFDTGCKRFAGPARIVCDLVPRRRTALLLRLAPDSHVSHWLLLWVCPFAPLLVRLNYFR